MQGFWYIPFSVIFSYDNLTNCDNTFKILRQLPWIPNKVFFIYCEKMEKCFFNLILINTILALVIFLILHYARSQKKRLTAVFLLFYDFHYYLNLSQPCTVRSLGRRVLCNFQTRQFRKLSGSGNETNFRFDHCNKLSKDSSINVKHSKWDKIFCPNMGNNIRHGK